MRRTIPTWKPKARAKRLAEKSKRKSAKWRKSSENRLRIRRRLRHSETNARASDGIGSCSGGKFVLSRAVQAYDAQARGSNRRFQLDSINQYERGGRVLCEYE